MKKLNERQKRFVQEYLVDLNATQAAIRAGYSEKTAGSQAFELLKKPEIQEAIRKAQAKLSERTGITQERVLAEYAKIAFADMRNVVKWKGQSVELLDSQALSDDAAMSVAEVKQTKEGLAIKLHDKKGALDSIAKHLGMFTDKVEVAHKDAPVLQVILSGG